MRSNDFKDDLILFKHYQIRVAALALYASLNTVTGTISTEHYVNKIAKELELTGTDRLLVANSRVFPVISMESIKEFLKLNKKNQILKLHDQIQRMFNMSQYQEIVDQTEEFAENHKLVTKTPSFSHNITK